MQWTDPSVSHPPQTKVLGVQMTLQNETIIPEFPITTAPRGFLSFWQVICLTLHSCCCFAVAFIPAVACCDSLVSCTRVAVLATAVAAVAAAEFRLLSTSSASQGQIQLQPKCHSLHAVLSFFSLNYSPSDYHSIFLIWTISPLRPSGDSSLIPLHQELTGGKKCWDWSCQSLMLTLQKEFSLCRLWLKTHMDIKNLIMEACLTLNFP